MREKDGTSALDGMYGRNSEKERLTPMNIALLGFGTVGKAFYELASGRDDLRVAAVLSRRDRPELRCTVTADFDAIVRDRSIDLVVEAMGGLEPAHRWICAAMRAGKHVVTANKQLMCAHYDELVELAGECGVTLRCTAAAGGGIPWLSSLARAARLDRITAVEGILNGTTNYMLSAMTASGADYAACLREAQALGYAEADPTADVEGLDARRKLVLSANIAFGVSLREEEIPCFGISSVTPEDFAVWSEAGLVCKLFVRAEEKDGRISAFVCPTLFPAASPAAQTNGTANLVTLYGARFGSLSFSGAGAGGYPTGSGVLSDCLDAAAAGPGFYTARHEARGVDNSSTVCRFYLRMGSRAVCTEPMSVADAFAQADAARGRGEPVFLARLQEGEQNA